MFPFYALAQWIIITLMTEIKIRKPQTIIKREIWADEKSSMDKSVSCWSLTTWGQTPAPMYEAGAVVHQ